MFRPFTDGILPEAEGSKSPLASTESNLGYALDALGRALELAAQLGLMVGIQLQDDPIDGRSDAEAYAFLLSELRTAGRHVAAARGHLERHAACHACSKPTPLVISVPRGSGGDVGRPRKVSSGVPR